MAGQLMKSQEQLPPTPLSSSQSCAGTYLPCYWHPVEDVPQHDPHHHFVPEVEDDTFAVVLPLGGDLGDCRVAGRNRDVRGLRLCLAL